MTIFLRPGFAAVRAALPGGEWQRLLGRAGFAGAIGCVIAWVFVLRLGDIPAVDALGHFVGLGFNQWLTAIVGTCASFWALGHYDGVIHRYLGTGARPAAARRAGITAIAISQTLGCGIVTGAILRWRMLPDQSLFQAVRITSLVALSFLVGLAVLTSGVLVAVADPVFGLPASGLLVIASAVLVFSVTAPGHHRINWPNGFVICRLLALTAVDAIAAATALWALCPADLGLPLAQLVPAFLLAFGAGIISGAPGGVGAFEMTLLAMLPHYPQDTLLEAILAWRVLYFAIPALIGAGLAIRGPTLGVNTFPVSLGTGFVPVRAETGLLAQGHLHLLATGQGRAWLSGHTAHCLIGLLDPLADRSDQHRDGFGRKRAITALMDSAAAQDRLPALYKCSAQTAVAARQLGFKLRAIAAEAWLDPRSFTLATPTRAGLRRKLRKAVAAGVTISSGPQNWADLARINAGWVTRHGTERGFSMGQFHKEYMSGQRIYVATADNRAIAFATFHANDREWVLDIMRHGPSLPDGTMHALVAHAIRDAADKGVVRFSLAAAPLAALRPPPQPRMARLVHDILGGNQSGLAQFKSCFDPHWKRLYLASPHWVGFALATAEIARAVHFPQPVASLVHDVHAEFEIATAR